MPVDCRETQDWLRPSWFKMSAPSDVATVENPSPNRRNAGTTERPLLTNHKPEPQVRRLPPESTTLARPLIIYCTPGKVTTKIDTINPFNGRMSSAPLMTHCCKWLLAAATDQQLFVFGEFGSGRYLSSCKMFDLNTNK
uniref:Kinesin motor domain-containing protein n=1 Tax=Mesocestoides corti TaxID=53468 RepID=A0A5K3FSW2_MESCO